MADTHLSLLRCLAVCFFMRGMSVVVMMMLVVQLAVVEDQICCCCVLFVRFFVCFVPELHSEVLKYHGLLQAGNRAKELYVDMHI